MLGFTCVLFAYVPTSMSFNRAGQRFRCGWPFHGIFIVVDISKGTRTLEWLGVSWSPAKTLLNIWTGALAFAAASALIRRRRLKLQDEEGK